VIDVYGNTLFKWNNIESSVLKLQSIKINIDKTKENFVSNRSLVTDKINDKFYLQKVEKEPMSFTLELGSTEIFTKERIEELANIFILDRYADLITYDNLHIYNCIANSSEFNVYGNGYSLSLDMVCSSPYSHSPWMESVDNLTNTTDISIENNGSIVSYPIFEINPINTGDTIRITNLTNQGKYFELGTDLQGHQLYYDEIIKVNMENNKLYDDLTKTLGEYRYSNISSGSEFFGLVRGLNILRISPCNVRVKHRYYYLT
jgi:phage-related protein